MSNSNGDLLDVRVEPDGEGPSVISLVGELDLSTIPHLEGPLLDELRNSSTVVLDLTQLVFIDSSGIGLLIKAAQVQRDGETMHIAIADGGQVERVFALTGIDRSMSLFRNREDAVAALKG